jgi:hypothetical protein
MRRPMPHSTAMQLLIAAAATTKTNRVFAFISNLKRKKKEKQFKKN